ncbi:serpin family protein [Actinopolymorpha pittospori]
MTPRFETLRGDPGGSMSQDIRGVPRRALLLGGLALPFLAACGRESEPERGDLKLVAAQGVERRVPPKDTPVAPTVAGMTAFGHALLGAAGTPKQNFVASPASIAFAFGMLRAGARGRTAAQIDQALRFPSGGPHVALNALTRSIGTVAEAPPKDSGSRDAGEAPKPPIVSIANSVFAQQDFEIRDAYLRVLAEQYGAGVQTLDLHAPDAVAVINAWVRQQTADRISKLFERLAPDIVLVLANAIYLRADWRSPFEHSATAEGPFTRTDGSTVKAQLMAREGQHRYATGDGWQAVELPYTGDELAMWVLVPTTDATRAAPGGLLAPATVDAALTGGRDERLRIVMPRWDFATTIDLKPVLQRMGMTVPFTAAADLSGIAEHLYVGQAVHRATITVDEFGSEAAAVTGVGVGLVSAPAPPKLVVRADRAFAFAIVHRPTRTPLFVGQVTDPS